ncbi:MAG: hypothetical protein M3461_20720 [Pseudomonadota bacterium]|nr:hypothetical protein [Pseudomonadota bacterium]
MAGHAIASLLLCHVPADRRGWVEQVLKEHGVNRPEEISSVRQVLVRRDAHAEIELLDDFAHRGAHLHRCSVLQPAVFHRKPVVKTAPAACLRMPAVVIPHLGNRLRLGFHEPDAEALEQRGLHRVHTEPPQGVFPARLAPVLALAVLLLQDRDRAHGIHHLLARQGWKPSLSLESKRCAIGLLSVPTRLDGGSKNLRTCHSRI